MSIASMPTVGWSPYTPAPGFGLSSRPRAGVDSQRILFFSDIHDKFSALERIVGGFDALSQQARQQGMGVLRVSGGDSNAGVEANELALGLQLTNRAANVMIPGNHDYGDVGVPTYAKALTQATIPTLASNMIIPPTSSLFQRVQDGKLIPCPMVYTDSNGMKYGVVGLATPSVGRYLNPEKPMDGVRTLPLKESIQRLQADVNWLRQVARVNRIIAVTHNEDAEDVAMARNTTGIDVILGAHTHQRSVRKEVSRSGEPVWIVKTNGNGRDALMLDLGWDAQGRPMPLQIQFLNPRTLPVSPAVRQLTERYLGPARQLGVMTAEISTQNVAFGGENPIGNTIADAVRMATRADIGMVRGGEIRNDIFPGPFTDRDLRALLPFSDKVVTFHMTGRQIEDVLRDSAKSICTGENHPGMIHPSGLRYSVDRRTGRVFNVLVQRRGLQGHVTWQPLNPQAFYTIAIGEFIAKNRTEYPVFKQAPMVQRFPFSIREAFGRYVLSCQGRPIPLSPLDGRVTVVEGRPAFQQWG